MICTVRPFDLTAKGCEGCVVTCASVGATTVVQSTTPSPADSRAMADSSPSPSPFAAPAPNPARLGTLYARGSVDDEISDEELAAGIKEALGKLGPRKKVIILPPRHHAAHVKVGR